MKRIIEITVVLAIASAVVFAAVDEKFGSMVTNRDQIAKIIQARNAMKDIRDDLRRTDAELDVIAKSGDLNTIDAELKAVLLRGRKIIADANDAFSTDPNLMKVLDWKPK